MTCAILLPDTLLSRGVAGGNLKITLVCRLGLKASGQQLAGRSCHRMHSLTTAMALDTYISFQGFGTWLV
jgi:hypothetical protein